jgi:hypothetical protein
VLSLSAAALAVAAADLLGLWLRLCVAAIAACSSAFEFAGFSFAVGRFVRLSVSAFAEPAANQTGKAGVRSSNTKNEGCGSA